MLTPTLQTEEYQIYTLPSGLRVAYYPEDSEISYAGYIVRTGASQDPHRYFGMAHLVEHMLFKGTSLRNARAIINRIEAIGGDLNAYTTKEETFLYAAFGRSYQIRALQLITDLIQHSQIPEDELAKEKTVIIEEINSYKDSPSELIFDEFENYLFHATPLGHNILGSEASVKRITSKAARAFREQYYQPYNMVLCLRGAFDMEWVLQFCEYHFLMPTSSPSSLPSPHTLPLWNPNTALLPTRRMVTHRDDTYQIHRLIGGFAYALRDERRIPFSLLINILGGPGMNSRLNLSLREEAGLVYTVESNYTLFSNAGLFTIYFGSAHKDVEEATNRIYQELEKLRLQPLTSVELSVAKRQWLGQLAISNDSRESAFLAMGKSVLFFGKFDSLARIAQRIEAITSENLQQAAQELFYPDRLFTLTYR